MKKLYLTLLSALLFFSMLESGRAQDNFETHVKNEVLVKFAKGASRDSLAGIHARFGTRAVEELGERGWQRVSLPPGLSVDEALKRFRGSITVLDAQPNFYYRLLATPNDPDFPLAGMYGLSKIKAPQAWDLSTGSSNVVVAVIDTGIRLTHTDLAANIWTNSGETAGNGIDDDNNGFVDDYYGWDFRYNDSDPSDQNGHGTHVAGTIGAVGNNNIGVVGVNWNVKLMAIKIYSPSGSDTTSATLINAYNYVRMMKERGVNIRVTNNSYGGCLEACAYDQATKEAIDALGDAGILNVFAAGNSGTNNDVTPFFPASYTSPSILSVGASNADDIRFYNYGAVSVDLAAPGIGIRSTTNGSDASYGSLSGTSMASPHAAGAAALLAGHDPTLSATSLKATLMNTVDQIPAFNGLYRTGGRLNIFGALSNPTVCTISPAQTTLSLPTKGGVFSITVSALSNCDYSVKSSVNWIKVVSPESATGNSMVEIRVGVNPTITRSGTIKIGGQEIAVTQSRNGNN
jgi:subtilisin family serine protease